MSDTPAIAEIDEFLLQGMREADRLTPSVPPMTPFELRIDIGSKWTPKSNPGAVVYIVDKIHLGRVHVHYNLLSGGREEASPDGFGLKFFEGYFQEVKP